MSNPTGSNQTAMELILAIKGLAQAVEFMHSDLRRLLDEADRSSSRDSEELRRDLKNELEKVKDQISKNTQTMGVLPITFSDRVEKLIDRLNKNVDGKVDGVIDDVRVSLNEVRQKLWYYLKEKENEKQRSDMAEEVSKGMTGTHMAILEAQAKRDQDVSGRIELTKDGDVRLHAKFDWKKLRTTLVIGKWLLISLLASGGVAGLIQFIRGL